MQKCSDFSPQKDLFDCAIDLFSASDEEVRSAAAFTAGNITIGNLPLFLPIIVKLVQTNQDKRLLALHSLKEVSHLMLFFVVSLAETYIRIGREQLPT